MNIDMKYNLHGQTYFPDLGNAVDADAIKSS